MKLTTVKLERLEQFEQLEKGHRLLIRWDKTTRNSANQEVDSPMITKVLERKYNCEIILDEPNNLYFNYKMFLDQETQGYSRAKEIYLILIGI